MFDPKSAVIQQNLPKVKELIMNPNVEIFFVPSSVLKEIVAKGEHPICEGMPDNRKSEILSGYGIRIAKKMVWDWINGNLDSKQAFILSHGDIRIVDSNIILSKEGK